MNKMLIPMRFRRKTKVLNTTSQEYPWVIILNQESKIELISLSLFLKSISSLLTYLHKTLFREIEKTEKNKVKELQLEFEIKWRSLMPWEEVFWNAFGLCILVSPWDGYVIFYVDCLKKLKMCYGKLLFGKDIII